jgi:hypothetical protein
VIASMLLASQLHAAQPTIAQLEISQLLESIATSGCEFYRNGSWYDAKVAQAHLRDKYQLLKERGRIDTAEDFIDLVATRSSLSGIPYRIRCHGGAELSCSLWLHDELLRLRTRDAPRQ